jgi:hypothetical protein
MHHIALCTLWIALCNCGHFFAYALDHAEPKPEFQAEQIQGVFGGPQASSCEDANIIVINASPDALNHRH